MSGYHTKENALKVCPQCRGQIAAAAKICPYCHHDSSGPSFGEMFEMGVAIIFLYILYSIGSFILELIGVI